MGSLTLGQLLQVASDKQNACAKESFGAFDGAICQNMIRSGARDDPNRFYRLQHLWADKWKAANPRARDFLAVDPAAPTDVDGAKNVVAINKLAATMVAKFRTVCEKACGAAIYMALGHGGVGLVDEDKKKLPARQAKLEADREALKEHRRETDSLDKTAPDYKSKYAERRQYEAEERDRLDCEDARINRPFFPTFSLGAQRGGLHSQYLMMNFEYFVYLDHPRGNWTDADRQSYDARKTYFAALKTIFQENQIKVLHLVACEIGKDSTFIGRVGAELGVHIVSYEHLVLIREVTGFIGLSTNKKDDDIAPATSVEPPRSPVVES